jgi:hypothetical protein
VTGRVVIARGYNMWNCIKKLHEKLFYYFETIILGFVRRDSGKPQTKCLKFVDNCQKLELGTSPVQVKFVTAVLMCSLENNDLMDLLLKGVFTKVFYQKFPKLSTDGWPSEHDLHRRLPTCSSAKPTRVVSGCA